MTRPTLALDLGTRTGWALWTEPTGKVSGTWRLDKKTRHPEVAYGGDLRASRLFSLLSGVMGSRYFDGGLLAYEDVQFSLYDYQTKLWATFRTVVEIAGMLHGFTDIVTVPVGTLKKFGAGHGAATKPMMSAAYAKGRPGLSFDIKGRLCSPSGRVMDDNEVDALHLLNYVSQ